MLYLLYKWFYNPDDPDSPLRFLRLFGSAPFRAACAATTAFFLLFFIMPWFIRILRRRGVSEQVRHYTELDTGRKSTVPTMGGLILIPAITLTALLWCDPTNKFVLIALVTALGGSLLGMADDLAKLHHRGSDRGLSRGAKYAGQIALGLLLAFLLLHDHTSPIASHHVRESFYLPFVKHGYYVGWLGLAIIAFFMVISTNAVNLTDGMDGLAAVPSILVFLVLGVFAFVIGDPKFAPFLQFFPYPDASGIPMNHHLPGAGELIVLCSAGAGAAAGFLWFNAFPATIMMGDTGSLGLGALLGTVAVLLRQEVIFLVAGGVFILELGSSFIQDHIGLKLLGRRIFYRAPFHSTMLHAGVSESKATIRLWIIAAVCSVFALATLKLR